MTGTKVKQGRLLASSSFAFSPRLCKFMHNLTTACHHTTIHYILPQPYCWKTAGQIAVTLSQTTTNRWAATHCSMVYPYLMTQLPKDDLVTLSQSTTRNVSDDITVLLQSTTTRWTYYYCKICVIMYLTCITLSYYHKMYLHQMLHLWHYYKPLLWDVLTHCHIPMTLSYTMLLSYYYSELPQEKE